MNKLLLFALTVIIGLSACEEGTKEVVEEVPSSSFTITSADFVDTAGVSKTVTDDNGDTFISVTEAGQWIAFQAEVTEAGRYRVEVEAASSDTGITAVWVEDYVDNKDGRTYNVTGDVFIENTGELATFKREGTPLNVGTHAMRLHFKSNEITVKSVTFTLMRARTATPLNLTQKTDGDEWSVVWSDEFDGEGLVDTSKWTYDIGDWGWGNNELQYYTVERTENARQENGNLIIEAHKGDLGHKWTSARLTTRGKVSFTYGKIEFRAKVPAKRGTWAAGWTLGDKYVDEISWPYCGEIDILESVGFETNDDTGDGEAHATIHCGAYYFKIGNQVGEIIDVKDMVNEFHTYAIEWTPDGLKAFVDDKEYFVYSDTSTDLSWPFSEPQDIILNLAMGGGWGGAQGMDDSYDSQQYIIDYVRVYEKK